MGVARFAGFVEGVLFCAELLGEIVGIVDAELSHHSLLFGRTGLTS